MIMQAAAFLGENKDPTEAQIKAALTENLCRCGTHLRIVRAIKRTAAIANAVFDAVGVRLRSVPFTPVKVRRALQTT